MCVLEGSPIISLVRREENNEEGKPTVRELLSLVAGSNTNGFWVVCYSLLPFVSGAHGDIIISLCQA